MEALAAALPSGESLFAAYADANAYLSILRQAVDHFIPERAQQFVTESFHQWWNNSRSRSSSIHTLIIEEDDCDSMDDDRKLFDLCEIYLRHKIGDAVRSLKVSSVANEERLSFELAMAEEFVDSFDEIAIRWRFVSDSSIRDDSDGYEEEDEDEDEDEDCKSRYFELSFDKKDEIKVIRRYLPFVVETSVAIKVEQAALKLHAVDDDSEAECVNLNHPFTFEKLAVDPEMKRMIIEDLDRFVRRKEVYKKMGKAWKRGYLLDGPPGTGKSSLIAAMANHLKFDIYDLQLSSVRGDSHLRELVLAIPNRSIIVVEDVDCSRGMPSQDFDWEDWGYDSDDPFDDFDEEGLQEDLDSHARSRLQMSLAGLLSFLDGLWSSCGDERIIVFTTNYKDMLDPVLLRAGRMDMHICMGYLTMPAFRVLATNYLDVSGDHDLFDEIESLIRVVNVTPAEVAEELLRNEDVDSALRGVVSLLESKKRDSIHKKLDDVEADTSWEVIRMDGEREFQG